MRMSHEQFLDSLRPTKEERNLIRVHSYYRGRDVAFCFGTITNLDEAVLAFRSDGEGKEIRIALHGLVFHTGIYGHEPHTSWRLDDTVGWSWAVFDVEYAYNRQQEFLFRGPSSTDHNPRGCGVLS